MKTVLRQKSNSVPMDAILPHNELTVVSLFLPVTVLKNQDKQGMYAAGKCWAGLVWMEVYPPGEPWGSLSGLLPSWLSKQCLHTTSADTPGTPASFNTSEKACQQLAA